MRNTGGIFSAGVPPLSSGVPAPHNPGSGSIWSVGVGRKRRTADGTAFDLVQTFGNLGAQGRVQRRDGHLEPPAHIDTFLPIVQQETNLSMTLVILHLCFEAKVFKQWGLPTQAE